MKADLFVRVEAKLGEGPAWIHGALWYVDILGECVGRVRAGSDGTASEIDRFPVGSMVGMLAPRKSGGLVVALRDRIAALDPNSGALTTLAQPEDIGPEVRFNDGKCDPHGRLVAGTMGMKGQHNLGKLYSFGKGGETQTLLEGIGISNGLAWTRDGGTFYYIDTPTRKVRMFDYDLEAGTIRNERTLLEVPESLGAPDGMTIDQEGNLWIANWGGYGVGCWGHTSGELLEWIDVPAPNVTSCTFGGPGLDRLFITTAAGGKNPDGSEAPEAGSIFVCTPGVRGHEVVAFAG